MTLPWCWKAWARQVVAAAWERFHSFSGARRTGGGGAAEDLDDVEPVPVLIDAFTESPALLNRLDVVRLSSTYQSVAEMLLSMGSDERVQRLPGIGPKKARRVAAVLRAPFPTRERRLESFEAQSKIVVDAVTENRYNKVVTNEGNSREQEGANDVYLDEEEVQFVSLTPPRTVP